MVQGRITIAKNARITPKGKFMFIREMGCALIVFTTLIPPAYGRLTPQTTVCVAALKRQTAKAELFQGKLQLNVNKKSGWKAWDAEFADVIARELIPINLKRSDEKTTLEFMIAPVSSAKRAWLHIMVGVGICTTEGQKICQGGTFRFPVQHDASNAAKIVMRELFTSSNQVPPCKEEWITVN